MLGKPGSVTPQDCIWLDGAVGETRMALVQKGRPVSLRVWRWSDDGRRARHGEIYIARVTGVDTSRRGAFLDLGLSEETGFLPLDGSGRVPMRTGPRKVREGELVTVEIRREGGGIKGPVAGLLLEPGAGAPRRLAAAESDAPLRNAAPAPLETRAALDEIFERALAPQAALSGGGVITIETTQALTAVDVDAGARPGNSDPNRFVRDLNIEAAQDIAVELRLRSIGGLVVIDFLNMSRQEDRRVFEQAARAAFQEDPWGATLAPLSRFGLLELSRPRMLRSLRETFLSAHGEQTVESAALAALRALEREALFARGRSLTLRAPIAVAQWLSQPIIAWRESLSRRIGLRFAIEGVRDMPVGRMEVTVQ